MAAYAVPSVYTAPRVNLYTTFPTCTRQKPSAPFLSSFIQGRQVSVLRPAPQHDNPTSTIDVRIRCDDTECITSTEVERRVAIDDWKQQLFPGVVIEACTQGGLRFGLVSGLYPKGVTASFVQVNGGKSTCSTDAKLSYGEIISVWHETLCPQGDDALQRLAADVDHGLHFLRFSRPRSLDLLPVYDALRRFPKNDPRATQSASQISHILFAGIKRGSRDRDAAITVAVAILLAADSIHFKRAGPGKGWRALPGSVAVARNRCSFVHTCRSILEHRTAGTMKRPVVWSREQLDILRDLEIYAASGTSAQGTAATALEALGYESTDDGAARLLLDIEYWATGTIEQHGARVSQVNDKHANPLSSTASMVEEPEIDEEKEFSVSAVSKAERSAQVYKNQVRNWTFPPEILAEARELRVSARERRLSYMSLRNIAQMGKRRNFMKTSPAQPTRVYCIDDKASRFLDDAHSVHLLDGGTKVRIATHVADVDEVVKSGSPLDELARERGQSLYLPLKPLHMLPAAAMDAASFSPSIPTEAITVLIDFDLEEEVICNWEVFASVLPPVKCLNFDQLDEVLDGVSKDATLDEKDIENLKLLARVAPLLAEKLDQRRPRRKQRTAIFRVNGESLFDDTDVEPRSVASVRIVKRNDRHARGTVKVAHVVDYRKSGAHVVIADMLTCAGALLRQFAKENRAHLPEDKGASAYVARCGTAPLRRYADLATQRQIKCVLFGRQPAGRRRMDELRFWLAKRQSAAERTVAERRRSALFDSLSDHCAQQSATGGLPYTLVRGQTRGISVTKKGLLKADVVLDGTGLSAMAVVSGPALEKIEAVELTTAGIRTDESKHLGIHARKKNALENEKLLSNAQYLLPTRSNVVVQIHDVNTVAQQIQASVVDILREDDTL